MLLMRSQGEGVADYIEKTMGVIMKQVGYASVKSTNIYYTRATV